MRESPGGTKVQLPLNCTLIDRVIPLIVRHVVPRVAKPYQLSVQGHKKRKDLHLPHLFKHLFRPHVLLLQNLADEVDGNCILVGQISQLGYQVE